jgi:ATPase subunit of ABC transporter with duplicated ATPase domains
MTYRINDNGTDRDMTPAEAAAYEQDAAAAQAAAAARAAAEEAAVAAKASAKAKLAALGLTEEEINALTGGI